MRQRNNIDAATAAADNISTGSPHHSKWFFSGALQQSELK